VSRRSAGNATVGTLPGPDLPAVAADRGRQTASIVQ
jgi:hypothetical protein